MGSVAEVRGWVCCCEGNRHCFFMSLWETSITEKLE